MISKIARVITKFIENGNDTYEKVDETLKGEVVMVGQLKTMQGSASAPDPYVVYYKSRTYEVKCDLSGEIQILTHFDVNANDFEYDYEVVKKIYTNKNVKNYEINLFITVMERNVVLERVLKVLQQKGSLSGIQVSFVDMRWGVVDDNTLDHRTWIECRKCEKWKRKHKHYRVYKTNGLVQKFGEDMMREVFEFELTTQTYTIVYYTTVMLCMALLGILVALLGFMYAWLILKGK